MVLFMKESFEMEQSNNCDVFVPVYAEICSVNYAERALFTTNAYPHFKNAHQ